jgi:hypothetical protein
MAIFRQPFCFTTMICSMETKIAVVRPLSFLALAFALVGQPKILAQTSTRSVPRSQRTANKLDEKGDVTFKPGSMGEIEIDHGVPLGFTDYTASDGVWLRVLYLTVTDQSQATLAFNQRLAHAISVIEKSDKRNADGAVIGERAEILAPSGKPASPYHAVVWTDGPTFHEVGSPSLAHVLQFEKAYRY